VRQANGDDGGGDGAREVPVGFPVSADWSGSRHLHVGPPREAGRRDVAGFDRPRAS
jgi:hypothetical protein